ncbi:MAG: 16S rRNA (adenine(1518)-N(6)/adenine(1519)-N(6))-dimethyltransferase RsmA [Pseudomonadota bacterium]
MRARRRFGQNFLHDPGTIDRIVAAIDPRPEHTLVEIGPGHGAISRPLAASGAGLFMVEIDRDLAAELAADPGLAAAQLHVGDALAVNFAELSGAPRYRLLGNLPYNISTPLIFHALTQREHMIDAHFLLQREVVDRMAASPGSRDFGRLSVMLQYHCDVEKCFQVAPGAFRPAPKVMSALVRLKPREPTDPVGNVDTLGRVVSAAFGQRRKQLGNALKALLSRGALTQLGVDPAARAEQLSVADFVKIADAVDES